MQKCAICGNAPLKLRSGDYETKVKREGGELQPLIVSNVDWLECESCGEIFLDHKAMTAIEAARRRALGLLTKEDFILLRKSLDLTQSAIAELLGIGEKTYCRWESGSYLHSEATDRYVRLLIENADNIELLKDICVMKSAETPEQQVLQLSRMFTSLDLDDPTFLEREIHFTSDLVEGRLQTASAP